MSLNLLPTELVYKIGNDYDLNLSTFRSINRFTYDVATAIAKNKLKQLTEKVLDFSQDIQNFIYNNLLSLKKDGKAKLQRITTTTALHIFNKAFTQLLSHNKEGLAIWNQLPLIEPANRFHSFMNTRKDSLEASKSLNALARRIPIKEFQEFFQAPEMKDLTHTERAQKVRVWLLEHKEDLEKINTLHLRGFGLKKIPKEILLFPNLKTLDLALNDFEEFPKELIQIKSLDRINLNNNKITKIPKELQNIDHRVIIDLSDNLISEFPTFDRDLKIFFHIEGNPIYDEVLSDSDSDSEFNF